MKLTIKIPNNYEAERQYVVSVIFDHFLGISYHSWFVDDDKYTIVGHDGQELTIEDHFFSKMGGNWLKHESLPILPLGKLGNSNCHLRFNIENEMPVIYGEKSTDGYYASQEKNGVSLSIDIFASTFFMLTRYEEFVVNECDRYGRFPSTASIAYKQGFLDRPIINEYVQLLWQCINYLWPNLERKERQFKTFATHDVDAPFKYLFARKWGMLNTFVGEIIKYKNGKKAFKMAKEWVSSSLSKGKKDPYNTFDYIMDVSEKNNLTSAFYFIARTTPGRMDGNYVLNNLILKELLQKIYQRGHEVGLHGSYASYDDKEKLKGEFNELLKIAETVGIDQKYWGGRQHYLRWKVPTTWSGWEYAGLNYDSTLSYADTAGFRAGVCYEYPCFDLIDRKALNLIERPLIVMECSVTSMGYMGLGLGEEAFNYIKKLKDECKKYQGNFVLLWHNSYFADPSEREFYESIMKG